MVPNLPRSGRLAKIIQEVTEDPKTTSKDLQASCGSVKVRGHDEQ